MNILSLEDERKDRVLLDIIELRKILELGIIDITVKKVTQKDIQKMEKYLNLHRNDLDNFPSNGDAEFHRVLTEATHNRIVIYFLDGIYDLIKGSLLFIDISMEDRMKGLEYHEKIFKAIKNNDAQLAKKIMSEHIDWLKNYLSVSFSPVNVVYE